MADEKYHSKSLESVTIPSGVTSIGDNAFYNCKSLKSVTIPDSVKSIGNSAFYECTNLTSVTISSGVTRICDNAFRSCISLANISIPDSVTYIDYFAFYNCKSLTDITIPDSVKSIGHRAFNYCTSLTSIIIPESVTNIDDNAFFGCKNLTIVCNKGSYAEKYAKKNSIPVEYVDEHTKEQALSQIKDTILENGAGTLTLDDFGDKHYNVQIESDSEIYTFKVSLPVSKTVGGVKVQGFKELGYIDVGKDEVGKTLKEIAENTAVVTSRKNGSKSLNELFKDNKGKTLD